VQPTRKASCECGSAPTPSDRAELAAPDYASGLERVVMELDKRVRKLESTR
jgi:hypothetical protein